MRFSSALQTSFAVHPPSRPGDTSDPTLSIVRRRGSGQGYGPAPDRLADAKSAGSAGGSFCKSDDMADIARIYRMDAIAGRWGKFDAHRHRRIPHPAAFLQNRRCWPMKESGEIRTFNIFWFQFRNPGKMAVVQIKNSSKTRVTKLVQQ